MKIISTDQAPQAIGPYVQAKIANGFLFASGQVPLDPVSGKLSVRRLKYRLSKY